MSAPPPLQKSYLLNVFEWPGHFYFCLTKWKIMILTGTPPPHFGKCSVFITLSISKSRLCRYHFSVMLQDIQQLVIYIFRKKTFKTLGTESN